MERIVFLLLVVVMAGGSLCASPKAPGVKEALASRTDLWGDLAMKQPNGASYEFFADLIPPLKYVNAEFKHYPIILSAPGGELAKFLLVSNGSAINPPPKLSTWHSNIGTSVAFFVGPSMEPFGSDPKKLDGPRYAKGYLPIVENSCDGIRQEIFAGVEPAYARSGSAFVRFSGKGQIRARFADAAYRVEGDRLLNSEGQTVCMFSKSWKWEATNSDLVCDLTPNHPAFLIVLSKPALTKPDDQLSAKSYDAQHAKCVYAWQSLLDRGAKLETPEPIVNNAWRSLVIGNYMLLRGDDLLYSWGNQYETMFEAECADAAIALLQFGHAEDVRKMLVPFLDFQQTGLLYHNAAYKLQLLEEYYWLTGDISPMREFRELWERELRIITDGREKDTGLTPKERYCGDIADLVYTLNVNAASWRGIRDLSPLLAAMGEKDESDRLSKLAADYRQVILKAVDKSMDRTQDIPFVPIALFGAEKAYPDITANINGSYWNLMIPFVLSSGVFPDESGLNQSIINYIQQHGGLAMGMIRFDQHSGLFANEKGVDDLYTLRYAAAVLRYDDPERAITSFYGKLAQGLTRDTFIGGEGSSLVSSDGLGRDTYLPPCVAGFFLQTLRRLMVQDLDMDDDGVSDTLRLMFATPRTWLEDGKSIRFTDAPTAFGKVSIEMRSDLKRGKVVAKLTGPPHAPKSMKLRARVPDGWEVTSASRGRTKLAVDSRGTVDLTGLTGSAIISFAVSRR